MTRAWKQLDEASFAASDKLERERFRSLASALRELDPTPRKISSSR